MAIDYKKRYVTPVGVANYPRLNEPDTKFNPDGEYKVNLEFDPEDPKVKSFIEKLEAIQQEAFDEFQKDSKRKLGLADVYEETDDGMYSIKFKQKAKIKMKDGKIIDVNIPIFDAKGVPMKDAPIIGKDSKIKISFTIMPYCLQTTKQVGLSLRPVAVQVIDLHEYTGGGTADAYGFEAEDGYEYEEKQDKDSWEDDLDDMTEEETKGDF